MKFSILMCGLRGREGPRDALIAHLQKQLDALGDPSVVEILVEVDEGKEPIGRKRNNLLDRATGEYIAYVDDDDWVAPYYVDEILHAVNTNPGIDCLSFRGIITTDGKDAHYFEHSLAHSEWFTREGIYYRTPNHLNPVRRELAARVGFPPINHGEDHDYSRKLTPLLKTHRVLPKVMYYYQFRSDKRGAVVSPPASLPVVERSHGAPVAPPEGSGASASVPFSPPNPRIPATSGPSGMPYPPPGLLTPNPVSTRGASGATGSPSSAIVKGRGRRKRTI